MRADLPQRSMQRTRCAGIATPQHACCLRQTCNRLVAVQVRVGVQHLLAQNGAGARVGGGFVVTVVVFLHLGVQGGEKVWQALLCDVGGDGFFFHGRDTGLELWQAVLQFLE